MTRPEKISRRKAFNKALRARAAEEQTSFVSVLQRTQTAQTTRSYRSMLNLPTHPHRPARRNMIGDHLRQTDLRDSVPVAAYEYHHDGGDETTHREKTVVVVDLMAIAKPAKVKGVAKEFEVVKRVKDVIVLDDYDGDSELDLDDWEAIDYDEKKKKTYSAALKGR